ncbi:DivIVA domain-containing protein [Micromonospora echinofusca]|uniref:DivIVA domain-containing protein n=1 Tax=Micromonospora echinofusca TaxID=47858 RepID=A0ABS3VWL9_MICEH|nr:DivIVA domain-containing protein [Micromonospora echinofusca]MBO4208890.1 DivIVA domain-containing protein [Micromonospora echinofusca]
MGQLLLILVVALTVGAVVFGVTVLVTGSDPGLAPTEPDGRSVPLPGNRPLQETDLGRVRFDTAPRGYRMAQVDQALRRAAYDIGYKSELIEVLEAEVTALREGRTAEADDLRRSREAALGAHRDGIAAVATVPPATVPAEGSQPAEGSGPVDDAADDGPRVEMTGTGTVDADGQEPADDRDHTDAHEQADARKPGEAAAVSSEPVARSEPA